jgi:hypothetical protein
VKAKSSGKISGPMGNKNVKYIKEHRDLHTSQRVVTLAKPNTGAKTLHILSPM